MLPDWMAPNDSQYYVVRREETRTPRAVRLIVETPGGLKEVWFPRSVISLHSYPDPDGAVSWKVGVPNWLAAKTGLLSEGSY